MAFDIGDPRERSNQAGPVRGGLNIQGVNSSGRGAVYATAQTEATSGGIPQFLVDFVEPYIQRKQQEMFVKGMTEQMQAGAEVEIIDDDNPISRIFGPTGYEQGASFFVAQQKIAERQTGWVSEMDELKKLGSDELSKKIADDMQGMLTGNSWADAIIQKSLVEQSGPLINTVTKARLAWQQSNGREAHTKAIVAGAHALQGVAVAQSSMTAPDEESTLAINGATRNFHGLLAKPEGMMDDSYLESLTTASISMMQEGDFVAYESIKEDMYNILDEKVVTRLEGQYLKYGTKAVEAVREQLMPQILDVYKKIETGEFSAIQAAAAYMQLNSAAQKMTGVKDIYLFHPKDIEQGGKRVIDVVVRTAERNEARINALADKQAEWDHEAAVRREEADAKTAVINTAWAQGDVNSAISESLASEGNFDAKAQAAFNTGRIQELVVPYMKEGWASSRTAETIQAGIASSIVEGYTDTTAQTYGRWKALYTANRSAAAEYFGKYHIAMLAFDGLMSAGDKSMTPELAFARTFGNPDVTDVYSLRNEDRKVAKEAITRELSRIDGGFLGIGSKGLNESAKAVIGRSIETFVAMGRKNSTVSVPLLARQAYDMQIKNGTLENYGGFAWNNPKSTTPLYLATKTKPEAFAAIFRSEVDEQLKASGFKAGANGQNYEVVRQGARIIVLATDDDGNSKTVQFTVGDLNARKGRTIKAAPVIRDNALAAAATAMGQ